MKMVLVKEGLAVALECKDKLPQIMKDEGKKEICERRFIVP